MQKAYIPRFQEFLKSQNLIPDSRVSFYAYWASRFIAFSGNSDTQSKQSRVDQFLYQLKGQNSIADWEVKQAGEAVHLYLNNFLSTPENKKVADDTTRVINEMRRAIRVRHYSYKTERSYIDWAKRFFAYTHTEKKGTMQVQQLLPDDVKNFLTHLAVDRKVSSSTQNQAFNALLFLFRTVLNIPLEGMDNTVRAKRGPRLPVVMSVDEVQRIFTQVQEKNLLILQLLYGSGLRLMEAARLRVSDIDFEGNMIFVRAAKEDKDRTTVLPACLKDRLKKYLAEVQSIHEGDLRCGFGEVYLPEALARKYPRAAKEWGWQYVFPASQLSVDPRSGITRRHHMSEKSIQNAMRDAAMKAGIVKHVTVHTLRHSFATHLLMNGVNIREIQELLGHKNIDTTMIYTHVMRDMTNVPHSPLDYMYAKKDKNEYNRDLS